MTYLLQVSSFSAAILKQTTHLITRKTLNHCCGPSWRTNSVNLAIQSVNLDLVPGRFHVRCYSPKGSSTPKRSHSRKQVPEPPAMEQEKDSFFVVRKGDLIGFYRSLPECQAQVGSSIRDPPVSVYKGNSLSKESEEYLVSCGLKNALYTIRAVDLTDDLFGSLTPCALQVRARVKGDPTSNVDTSSKVLPSKRSQDVLQSEVGASHLAGSSVSSGKHVKLNHDVAIQVASSGNRSCILEFDGASKGNPGQAGAGAVLRTENGNLICKLREGLGKATNNVAEYRAIILGLKYAVQMGYSKIIVRGDSKLVCMQIQGLWKVRHEGMTELCDQAKKLKDKFRSFRIDHVLREFNSEADAQANLAACLADGQIQQELV